MKNKNLYFPIPTSTLGFLIKRKRLNCILHSSIYYVLDDNLIDDHTFDKLCKDTVQLLQYYPFEYSDRFDEYFKDWTGASGHHFPIRDPWVLGKAQYLININKEHNNE